jgi:hypothetical protein
VENLYEVTMRSSMGAYFTSDSMVHERLCELARATTAYHEAPPERVEDARQQYEDALRAFKAIVDPVIQTE